jgi:hypothetical protein
MQERLLQDVEAEVEAIVELDPFEDNPNLPACKLLEQLQLLVPIPQQQEQEEEDRLEIEDREETFVMFEQEWEWDLIEP